MPARRDGDVDARERWALFRYRVIAEAVEAPPAERGALLRALASRPHWTPDGEEVRISLRTLQRWAARYLRRGLGGLVRQVREDKGGLRGVTEAVIERAIALRKEVSRSTRTLIDVLERSGVVVKGSVKRSTLDRHLDRRGGSRRQLGLLGVKRHVRLHFEHPLDFVVGDFHDGPWVLMPDGTVRRAKLEAFIDHCSRYVVESRYGLSEDTMAVRRGLMALCTAWGLPRKIYVDRGPGYQAGRFHFGCSQLDIKLCHSKPYVSEGRGVIERFNRTTKEGFELEVRARSEPPTLELLNEFWRAWLEERYQREPHSETGEPPHERWRRLLETTDVRRPDPELLDEVLRLKARGKVHTKTSTVEVCAVPFVVDTALRGRKVDVLYDPHDLSSVLVYFDGRRIQRAFPQVRGEPPVSPPEPPPPPSQSVDYLELLRRDHRLRRAAELAEVRFRPVKRDDTHLTLTVLLGRLRACCGRSLGAVEREQVAATLDALSPLEVALADAALKTAVATLGHGLHATQYLEALRGHVLRLRTKGPS